MTAMREQRARLEELQGAIKQARAELSAGEPEEFLRQHEAAHAEAERAEGTARDADAKAMIIHRDVEALRHEVELAEQAVLGPRTQTSVPLAGCFTTLLATVGALWGLFELIDLPRTGLLVWAVKGAAAVMLVPVAWVVKRRVMRPELQSSSRNSSL